jgi:hypothetical protein
VNGPRKRKLGPVDDRQFRAKLLLPTRDRLGSALTLDLGVVDGDGPTTLRLPDLRCVLHRGRVRLPAGVPPERVAILANRQPETGEGDELSSLLRERPFAACLGSDASFVIDLPQGRYVLQLVDLETGIVCHTDGEERTLGAATAPEPIEIAPTIRWLTIDLVSAAGDGPVVVQGIVVNVDRPDPALPALLGPAGGSPHSQHMLVPCLAATSQLRWLVPAAALQLDAVQSFQLLSPTNTDYGRKVVASDTVDASSPEPRVTLHIPPPPDDVR